MKKIALFLSSILLFTAALFAQNNEKKFKGWKKAETEHFTFIYEDAQKEATQGYIKIADDAWNQVGKIYAFPQDKTNVYVTGRTNTVNAFTYFSPAEIGMFTNPCTLTDFTFRDNWQKLFFTHELIHIANINFEDKSKLPELMFGSFMTSVDMSFVNGWALEGLATVLETELTNGGRGRSPYFELKYKSLTLDNGFLPYENIGLEKEPPYGQRYVMGFLIMRSIADRYGIQALADIERNRTFMGSWEESVQNVTGESAQNIYRDVRIALAKKYADERKIPEGIIISPRELNTNYFKPAIVFDDGTLISLRSAAKVGNAVVRLDPAAKKGRNFIEDTKAAEKDSKTLFTETVLFSGNFMDEDSITADENGTIYAALGIQIGDKAPGTALESSLHVWKEGKGLKRLTKNVSLFQPSVSRDGSLLVAVEQHGMDMRLVKIDTETGKTSVLFEKPGFACLQPAVNADATKVAFLLCDDNRARVAVLDVNNPSDYRLVANDGEEIYDPTEPVWNSDGSLIFCCNYRGRLEMFEADLSGSSAKKTPKPVVADPIGASWAYKNSKGIFYTSLASSGSVIKIKPEGEWGQVPAFEGPTPAGQIIHFGQLENDYSDFKPYTVSEENNVKHRSQENIEKAERAESKITELENEKTYIPQVRPILYFPSVDFISFGDRDYFGFGLCAGLLGPHIQSSNCFGGGYLFYYPELYNFEGFLAIFSYPLAHTAFDFTLSRKFSSVDEGKLFLESNTLSLGYTHPLYSRQQGKNDIYFCGLAYAAGEIGRYSDKALSVLDDAVNAYGVYGGAGFEFALSQDLPRCSAQTIDFVLMGTSYCSFFNEKNDVVSFGLESELSYLLDKRNINYELSVKGRYTPYPENICPPNSGVKYGGRELDCSMPVRIVPRVAFVLPKAFLGALDTKAYCEMLLSADPQNKAGFDFDRSLMTGLELGMNMNHIEVAMGSSLKLDYDDEISMDSFNFYLRLKLSWYRM